MKKGGKLQAKIVKDFLNASYQKNPPAELDGFTLDRDLSSDTAKVYYNPNSNHAVVVHRGTQGLKDWGNNLAYAVGAYEKTKRFKQGKAVQQRAEAKYGKENISTLGHSQGAVLARKLGKQSKEIINVNPAYTFEKPHSNEFNVRSSSDVVSGLYTPVATARKVLYPQFSKHHDITIPSERPTDIIKEHSPNILDRMGDSVIGHGRKYTPIYIPMRRVGGRRSSDINWYGGAVSDYNSAPSDDTNLDVAHTIGTGETPQFDFSFNPEVYTMNDAPYNLGEGHMPQTNYLGGRQSSSGANVVGEEDTSEEEEEEEEEEEDEVEEPTEERLNDIIELANHLNHQLQQNQSTPQQIQTARILLVNRANELNQIRGQIIHANQNIRNLYVTARQAVSNALHTIVNITQQRGGARRRRRDVEDTRELIKEILDRIKYLDDNINTLHAEIQHNRHLLHHPTTSEEEAIELQEQIERDKEELIRDTQEKEEKQEFLFKLKANETEFKGEGRKKACWKGYEQYGMKTKKGRQVPNCIPIKKGGYRHKEPHEPSADEMVIMETLNAIIEANGVFKNELLKPNISLEKVKQIDDYIEFHKSYLIRVENETRGERSRDFSQVLRRVVEMIDENKEIINRLLNPSTPNPQGPIPQEEVDQIFQGYGRKKAPKIDFEEVKWGTFKNLLQRYNKEHPQAPLKDLHQLASLIIKHPENFSKVAHKKALFYKNIIEKK